MGKGFIVAALAKNLVQVSPGICRDRFLLQLQKCGQVAVNPTPHHVHYSPLYWKSLCKREVFLSRDGDICEPCIVKLQIWNLWIQGTYIYSTVNMYHMLYNYTSHICGQLNGVGKKIYVLYFLCRLFQEHFQSKGYIEFWAMFPLPFLVNLWHNLIV